VINQISGPVLLAGHSYAGAILSNVGSMTKNIAGLVYVAAFVLNEGQTLNDVGATSKESILGPNLVEKKYPKAQGKEAGVEFVIKADQMRAVFAADVPEQRVKLMAAAQRPIADLAFTDICGPPTWKNVPAWAIVATKDKAAGTDAIRAAAQQGDIKITELEGSHAIMVSRPQEVADVILHAAGSL
jgi:pimeloyl-ACP methyl ester carboxylesterase